MDKEKDLEGKPEELESGGEVGEVVTPDGPIRVKTPGKGQLLGVIEERLGNRRSKVRCSDGHIRICRIPGRVRRRMWTREGDIVLLEPWSVQENERGDLLQTYSKPQIEWLQKKGHLKWM